MVAELGRTVTVVKTGASRTEERLQKGLDDARDSLAKETARCRTAETEVASLTATLAAKTALAVHPVAREPQLDA